VGATIVRGVAEAGQQLNRRAGRLINALGLERRILTRKNVGRDFSKQGSQVTREPHEQGLPALRFVLPLFKQQRGAAAAHRHAAALARVLRRLV